jgi:hypothetical protein
MESGGERERACVNAHRELEIGGGGGHFHKRQKKKQFYYEKGETPPKKFIKGR